MSTKSRSTSAELAHKNSSSTSKSSSKMSGGSPWGSPDSELKPGNGRNSADKSPKSLDSKSSKTVTTNSNNNTKNSGSEKKLDISTSSELHQQLGQAQVDLKNSMDQLAIAEDAKSRALEEVKEMKKMADGANLRLSQVLAAQKHMEENSEISKFGIDELEQARVDAAKKRDQVWQLQFDAIQKQQLLDAAELLATKEELKKVKKDLSLCLQERDLALNLADDARKIADMNLKKVEDLSSELVSLRGSLDLLSASRVASEGDNEATASKWEVEARESALLAAQSNLIIESMRKEIARTQDVEMKLAESETLLGKLKLELSNARDSESEATNFFESKERIEVLEKEIVLSKESEGKALELIILLTRQLEETKMSLEEATLEISSLREKMEAMESSVRQTNNDLEASHLCLGRAKIDLHDMGETVESLRSELKLTRDNLLLSQERESLAVSNMQALLEEANRLRIELRLAMEAEEKSKKALDDLAMVLREVTDEANQTKAELESSQAELEKIKCEAEPYRLKMDDAEDELQSELQKAREEMERLKEVVERARLDSDDLTSAWKEKEMGLINCIRISEQEIAAKKEENDKLILSLRDAEERAEKAEEEKLKLMDPLEQAETESNAAREAFELLSMENLRLRESFSEIHKELESALHENECLKEREAAAVEKNCHLMRMLESTSVANSNEKISLSGKVNHVVLEEEKRSPESCVNESTIGASRRSSKGISDSKSSGKTNSGQLNFLPPEKSTMNSTTKKLNVDPVVVNGSVYASAEAELHDFERQYESIDHISDVKPLSPSITDGGDTLISDDYHHIDGPQMEEIDSNNISPSRQRKKKALLRRFGDLLKKKSSHK